MKIVLVFFLTFFSLHAKDEIVGCVYTVLLDETKTSNGTDLGLGRDMIKLLQERISTPITIQSFTHLEELQKSAMNRECDMIPLMEKTPERLQYFNFTKHYFEVPIVMATKQGLPFINNINMLKGKKIAAVKGHSYLKRFIQKYPKLEMVAVDSREEGLDLLRKEEVFGFLDFAQILNFIIMQKHMRDIAITAQFNETIKFSVAVRNDDAGLLEIFEQALADIEPQKLEKLILDWYSIGYEREANYKLLLQIIFVTLVIIATLIYWNMKFKDDLAEKEKKQLLYFRQNKLAQMGEMIENIAHQWRQPLAQINASTLMIDISLQKEGISNPKVAKKLSEIDSLTKYMSQTIDDFKNFFHPDKKRESFSLFKAISEALKIANSSLEANFIDVHLMIDKELQFYGYPDELKQVILAMLTNSRDAFVANKIDNPFVEIITKEEEKYLNITLKDNAGGISKEVINKIFDPYFTTKHHLHGTGLGLYMAKTIIEKSLNGMIGVNSADNQTVFEIILPKEKKELP